MTVQELMEKWPTAITPQCVIPTGQRVYPDLTARLELWSPEYAKFVWDNATRHNNRNIKGKTNPMQVKKLQSEMQSGNFHVTGDAQIIFDWNAVTINGHHTIEAQIKSNTWQVYMVCRGSDPASYDYIDIGTKRGMNQTLPEYVKNKTLTSAVSRMLCTYDNINGDERFGQACEGGDYTAQQDVRRYWEANEAAIYDGVHFAPKDKSTNFAAPSVMSTCYVLFARYDREATTDFFDLLFSGANLQEDNPVFHLRARLLDWRIKRRSKTENREIYALMFIAWKHFLTRKPVTSNQIRWRQGATFPVLRYKNAVAAKAAGDSTFDCD